jgi:hypothetical protein
MARQSDIRGKWPRQAKCRLCGGEGRLGKLGELPEIVSAEKTWREYLLEQRETVAPHDLHACHMGAPPPQPHLRDLPPNLGRYMLRSVGCLRCSAMISDTCS